ncbi:MAG: hypothetical protein IKY70_05540 [Bacteroidales bacterium]|nr:hypothetical protein [Bacteroidales bacterium]
MLKRCFGFFMILASICFTTLAFSSCSSGSAGKGDDDKIKVIDIAGSMAAKPVEVKLSELAESIEYIPIDMGEEFFPDYKMMDMIVDEDAFCFVPKPNFPDGAITCLSSDGKLVSSFKHIGRAENEYIVPLGVILDKTSNMFILNDAERAIKYYTREGDYVKSFMYDEIGDYRFLVPGIIPFGGKVKYLARHKENNNLYSLEFDDNGKIASSQIIIDYSNIPEENWTNPAVKYSSEIISRFNGNFLMLHKFEDILYNYNGLGTAQVAFGLDFGNLKEGVERKVMIGGYSNEMPEFLILQMIYRTQYFDNLSPEERMNYLLIDKSTGKGVLLAKDGENNAYFKNDLDGGMPFFPYHIEGNKMYQIVDAYKFIEYAENSSSQAMKKVAEGLTEESNPVIIVVTLK